MNNDVVTIILQAISTVGFPIVMCLLMFKNNKDTIQKLTDGIAKMQQSIDEMKQAIKELGKND